MLDVGTMKARLLQLQYAARNTNPDLQTHTQQAELCGRESKIHLFKRISKRNAVLSTRRQIPRRQEVQFRGIFTIKFFSAATPAEPPNATF